MRIYEIINEYKIEKITNSSEEFIVMVDPDYKQLKRFAERSEYQELRGIYEYDSGSFYWWDANKLIHNAAVKELGLEPMFSSRLELGKSMMNGEELWRLDYSPSIFEKLKIEPYIERNFDITDEGWMEITVKQ